MKNLLKVELPNAPSYLIELALADLAKTEADSRYEIDMTQWHYPAVNGPCSVCFAGAVLAQEGTISPRKYVNLWDLNADQEYDQIELGKLLALDHFRLGMVRSALVMMGRADDAHKMSDRQISPYGLDPVQFHEEMTQLVNDLRRAGL
jgi:hypothetical protein